MKIIWQLLIKPFRWFARRWRAIQEKYFPNERQKALAKWWNDRGDQTLRLEYDLNENSLVMDIGGYEGQWASDIFSKYLCTIHVFEPIKDYAQSIAQRFRRNPRITIHAFGLGDSNTELKISCQGAASSFFGAAEKTQTARLTDVKEWIERELPRDIMIDLMKINIEGGEYQVLPRLIETGLIRRIKNIQVQFHDIEPDSVIKMRKIQDELTKTHRPTYQYHFVWENWTLKD